jgi:hypothetical protein
MPPGVPALPHLLEHIPGPDGACSCDLEDGTSRGAWLEHSGLWRRAGWVVGGQCWEAAPSQVLYSILSEKDSLGLGAGPGHCGETGARSGMGSPNTMPS